MSGIAFVELVIKLERFLTVVSDQKVEMVGCNGLICMSIVGVKDSLQGNVDLLFTNHERDENVCTHDELNLEDLLILFKDAEKGRILVGGKKDLDF